MLLAVREAVNMSSLGNNFNKAMLDYIVDQAKYSNSKEEIVLQTLNLRAEKNIALKLVPELQ